MLSALIWDVDGTLAETERDGHRVAFNAAFEQLALPWRWDVATYGELLRTAGGLERLLRFLATRDDAPRAEAGRTALARAIHRAKNDHYARIVAAGALPLRPGVVRLVDACSDDGLALAIATTTSRRNVDGLLAVHLGRDWADRFGAIVCAEEAPRKKPDPSAYRLACERLAIAPADALAIEDSPNGVVAARALGIPTLVTRSAYFADDRLDGAVAVCDDLDHPVTWPTGSAPRVDLDVLRTIVG